MTVAKATGSRSSVHYVIHERTMSSKLTKPQIGLTSYKVHTSPALHPPAPAHSHPHSAALLSSRPRTRPAAGRWALRHR